MKKRATADLRRSIEAVAQTLAERNVKVTQIGNTPSIRYDRSGIPTTVNIPAISDDAGADAVNMIRGFVDTQVSRVLFSNPGVERKVSREDEDGPLRTVFDGIDRARTERKMKETFSGSARNLSGVYEAAYRKKFQPAYEEIVANGGDAMQLFNGVLCQPAMRALAGDVTAEDFMSDKWESIAPIMDKLGDETIGRVRAVETAEQAHEVAAEIVEKIRQEEPPPQQQGGESSDSDEEDSGESEGSNSGGDESDEEDTDESEGANAEGGEEDSDESDGDESDGDESDGDEEDSDESDGDESEGGDESGEEDSDESDGDESDGDESEGANSGGDEEDSDESDGEDSDGEDSDGEDSDESGPSGNEAGGVSDGTDNGAGYGAVEANEGTEDFGGWGEFDPSSMDDAIAEVVASAATADVDDWLVYDVGADVIESIPTLSEVINSEKKSRLPLSRALRGAKSAPKPVLNALERETERSSQHLQEAAKTSAGPLRSKLRRMVLSQGRVQKYGGQRRGRVDGNALARLRTGDTRVFYEREVSSAVETTVSLLIDGSGSMGNFNKMQTAIECAYVMGQTLDQIGVESEIAVFSSDIVHDSYRKAQEESETWAHDFPGYGRVCRLTMGIVKSVDESFSPRVRERLAMAHAEVGMNMNGNNDEAAIAAMRERMVRRGAERKILIVLSDGNPVTMSAYGDMGSAYRCAASSRTAYQKNFLGSEERRDARVRREVELCEEAGIQTFGIGIMDSSVRKFYERCAVLSSVSDLPDAAMGELLKMMDPHQIST